MQRGVPPGLGETVAEHSFSAALIALEVGSLLRKKGINVNPELAAAIAVAHDLPEVLVGDIPKWSADRLKELKEKLESDAIDELNHLDIMDYAKMYIELGSREAALAKVSEVLATKWRAERYVAMGLKRVKEISESMDRVLEKVIVNLKERDPEFGEALEEALGEVQ
jgi:putative hydrolase of HD superfamily